MPNKNVVAIVPARGGSKGIPGKNLKKIGGVSLVVKAMQVGQQASRVDRTIVTTDDEEIQKVVLAAGGEVIMRPKELAEDKTPTIPVLAYILDVLNREGWCVDIIVLLEPTSPFRTPAVVDKCVAKLDDDQVSSSATVTQLERNPNNIFVVNGDQAERYIKDPVTTFTSRQNFSHLKRINGCVYVSRKEWIQSGKLLVEPIRVVEMTAEDSINIDTMVDLNLARLIADDK